MLKNKKLIIISAIIVLVVIALVVSILLIKKHNNNTPPVTSQNQSSHFTPDFLNTTEKAQLGLPADVKIEALERGTDGQVTVYKVINNNSDVVDPATVRPISPRQKSATSAPLN